MKRPNPQDREDDAAALLTMLTTALLRERAAPGTSGEPPVSGGLNSLNVESPLAQHVVIQKTRVRLWDWLNRPWDAKEVVAYQKRGGLAPDSERSSRVELPSVFRAAMMIRYGVAVEYPTFRALQALIVDGVLTEPQLKKILQYPNVWWGTAVEPSPQDGPFMKVVKRIWSMGRPSQGRLMVIRFHWATRLMLGLMTSITLAAVAFLIYAAVASFILHGPTQTVAVFLWAMWQVALLSAGLLWFGSYGDRAARVLSERLPIDLRHPLGGLCNADAVSTDRGGACVRPV